MAKLPDREDLVAQAIYETYARGGRAAPRRPHLGASLIGHPCDRGIWYTFRWASPQTSNGRLLRLFDTGKLEEPRVLRDLRNIGCEVHDVDPVTKRQFRYYDHGGHFAGSIDGAVLGVPGAPATWHLLEIKTHNDKSFAGLLREGIQGSKQQHLAQCQVYMGWTGLTRALYFAVGKNDDQLYTERIAFNIGAFQGLRSRALNIITATEPPEKTENPLCAFCEHESVCGGRLPLVHCRTCLHCTPIVDGTDGRWVCRRDNSVRNQMLQERGCDEHLFIPGMVKGTEVERGDGFVVYERAGVYFANSTPTAFPAIAGDCLRSTEMVAQ
jgi:hypothetical protein